MIFTPTPTDHEYRSMFEFLKTKCLILSGYDLKSEYKNTTARAVTFASHPGKPRDLGEIGLHTCTLFRFLSFLRMLGVEVFLTFLARREAFLASALLASWGATSEQSGTWKAG